MMEKKNKLIQLMLTLLVGATLYSCVDNDYDLSKDVDLTMGLGSDKLALKIGDTEKIYLRDMLDIENSEVDTLKTGRSLYYLVKDGETSVNVEVDRIPVFSVAEVDLIPAIPIVPPTNIDVDIPQGKITPKVVDASNEMNVDIENIPVEIKRLRNVYPSSQTLKMTLFVEQPSNASFVISDVKNLKITFPDFLYSSAYDEGAEEHSYTVGDIMNNTSPTITLPSIPVDYLQFGEEADFGQLITDRTLIIQEDVKMEGEFTLNASRSFTLGAGQEVNVKLIVELGDIDAERITGIVSPLIDPTVDPIEIAEDLPVFLQDPEVVLEVSNPTIKFDMKGGNLPIPLLFSGVLTSVKDGQAGSPVRIPVAPEYDNIPESVDHVFYFYQKDAPFDPNGVNPSDRTHLVPNLSTLIRKVPDYIDLNLSDGKIRSNESRLHAITLGEDFNVELDYEVLIPFTFNRGLRIVYLDSIPDMNEDLKDYQASGLTLTATAVNSIPLDLNFTLVPIGFSTSGIPNQDLSEEIEVEAATIPAASGAAGGDVTEADISIVMKARNPEAVSRLDKLEIRVDAESTESSELTSAQYFFLRDMRIKLNGQIIANFN